LEVEKLSRNEWLGEEVVCGKISFTALVGGRIAIEIYKRCN
jgi:hypothetical protein